jgi:predicted nucleotidyltransferase
MTHIKGPTPYEELNAVLQRLVADIRSALGETFIGAYLQGSFAVGDFDEHSDIDFIVVTGDELSDSRVETLQAVHGTVYDLESEWARHLEGSYFPASMLRDRTQRGSPGTLPERTDARIKHGSERVN